MSKNNSPFAVLRASIDSLRSDGQILYPFLILAFINLALLEIVYFIPRHPLVEFLGPVVSRIWNEQFLHYPMDLLLLPKLFYYAQMFFYLMFGSFLLAVTAHLIAAANNSERVSFKLSFKKSLSSYLHILLYSLISLGIFQLMSSGFDVIVHRALKIQSTQGIFFIIKKTVTMGVPFAQFLFGVIITILLAYVVPINLIEKKKIIKALIANFKMLFSSFWMTTVLVIIPTIFYIPVLILRNNVGFFASVTAPEIQLVLIIIGIFVTLSINTLVLAATTTYYLHRKENP
jgi:hypothetical protein